MEIKKLQSFKDLNVWQKSSNLAVLVYKITNKFPHSELYGLTNQMRRAVISISSNIAEGFKRNHKKEKLQFYNVAYSSVAELESQIEVSYKLGYLSAQDYQKILSLTVEVSKMTDGLIKSVRKLLVPKLHILFFFISLFSIFYILIPLSASAAFLYLMPQSQTVYQDDSFILEMRLDSESKEINTVKVDLKFPSNFLEVVDIAKGGSILTLWPKEPTVSNNRISFLGGVPGGFNGDGIIGKIIFKGKKISKAKVNFEETCQVLLNDGKGTLDSLTFLEANCQVIKKPEFLPIISSTTHPDQNKWFKSNNLHLRWNLIKEAQYSYLLSHDPLAEPDEIPDKPEGELIWMGDMKYKGLEDGIYYFTLKQKISDEAWSERVSYRVMIDSTAPEQFSLEIAQDTSIFEGKYFIVFQSLDKQAGIDCYEIKEGEREWKRAESPYLLEDQTLQSIIKAKAVDKAGNERIAEYVPEMPEKAFPYQIILIILGLAIIGWYAISKIKYKKLK
ncbi:four helix bundle protein [Candidatus Parcubacteria bacterium]|nr:four helix bundle protein [Candidatus Parcubacteria bacterium]